MPLGANHSASTPSLPSGPRRSFRCSTHEAEFADTEGELSPAVVDALHREAC